MANTDVSSVLEEQLQLVQALSEIAQVSAEAEVVRIALAVLTRTNAGLAYLTSNPLIL